MELKNNMKITAVTKYKHGKLYEILSKIGWTQKELSKRSKIPATTIGNIINLHRRPTIKQANAIQSAFGQVGVFLDVLHEWPDTFRGLARGFNRVDTADVPMETLIGCEEAYQLPAPDLVDTSEMSNALCAAINTLTTREKTVVDCYFYKGQSSEETGREIRATRERVRQILAKALRKLRHPERVRDIKSIRYKETTNQK